jgi:adenylate kinase family enzyme
MTLIVNLFAGPGAGKSTLAAKIFAELKERDVNCELVVEYAKDLTWEKRHTALKVQPYVFGKQLMRIERVLNQVDCIITDSPILLSSFYAGKNYPRSFNDYVLACFNEYNNYNLFVNRKKKYNPRGRNQTEEEAKVLDNEILNFLKEKNIPLHTITTGSTSSLTRFINTIKEEFNQ